MLQDGSAPEYMYHDRTAWRCAFLWEKNMDAAKDIHKEMLFVDILCFHIFCPQKTHVTLFYRGTCIKGRRHLVTTDTSVQSCTYRSLCVTMKLNSAAM
jgi:hypothetical protein